VVITANSSSVLRHLINTSVKLKHISLKLWS